MDFKNEIENECGFHVQKIGEFCSPADVVDKLKDYVVNFSDSKLIQSTTNNKTILETLKSKYNCDSESCVLNQYDIKRYMNPELVESVLKDNFKPVGPKLSKEWLSNFDIDDVLKQIQKKYIDKHFLHIPFQMRDFEKTNSDLARLDWQAEYNKGYRTFGTVMNTDYSSGKGIHWFAIFGEFLDSSNIFTIEYFNSSGELPLPEVTSWMKRTKHALTMNKEVKDIVATRLINQEDSSSCGVYSLFYIISRLDGIPLEWFKKNRIKDETMYEFRKYLFREDAATENL
jgi:hypothetical protein